MTTKTKTRKITWDEYEAIFKRIFMCPRIVGTYSTETSVWMLDDEFQPTQNMASIRWIVTDSYLDVHIFQVDNAGDAILLIRGD
jgi:hypothetical protein